MRAAGSTPGTVSAGFSVSGATWTAFSCPVGDGLEIEIEIDYRTRSEILDEPERR